MRFLCIVVDCYHAFNIFLQLYLSVAQLKVVLLSLPFDCMQESHRSCFHRKLAWLPPSVFYLVMVSVLLLLRAISLNAWTGTLPQPGERYVVCYMCTKVCMLHVVLYVLNHRLHHPDPRPHHHRHRHHRPHHLHLHLLRYIRGGTGLSHALSFSASHIWAQIACLSKKNHLISIEACLLCSRVVFSYPVKVKPGQPRMCVLVQSSGLCAATLRIRCWLCAPVLTGPLCSTIFKLLENQKMPPDG